MSASVSQIDDADEDGAASPTRGDIAVVAAVVQLLLLSTAEARHRSTHHSSTDVRDCEYGRRETSEGDEEALALSHTAAARAATLLLLAAEGDALLLSSPLLLLPVLLTFRRLSPSRRAPMWPPPLLDRNGDDDAPDRGVRSTRPAAAATVAAGGDGRIFALPDATAVEAMGVLMLSTLALPPIAAPAARGVGLLLLPFIVFVAEGGDGANKVEVCEGGVDKTDDEASGLLLMLPPLPVAPPLTIVPPPPALLL